MSVVDTQGPTVISQRMGEFNSEDLQVPFPFELGEGARSARWHRRTQRPGTGIGKIGEDPIDTQVAELPELGADITTIRG